jgi:NADH-quinone oxidoreductase subunit G
LFAQRIRQAARRGCKVDVIASEREFKGGQDWAMPVRTSLMGNAQQWGQLLANVAAAVAADKGTTAPVVGVADEAARSIAAALGQGSALLLGNAAAHHANASGLLAIANWIGAQTGATVGYLTEAANTVGAQLVRAQPTTGGMHAGDMLAGKTKALVLLNVEPGLDTAPAQLGGVDMVVSMSPFKANMDVADVLLPIAPFTETSGSFVNAEGLLQSFHAVVKPLGETRPAWKVLRVLCNMLDVPGVQFDTSQEVLAATGLAAGLVDAARLSNATTAPATTDFASAVPVVAGIYELDGLVRRAAALQHTADAQQEVFA